MSQRDALIAIISMAQQASPNSAGQTELALAQLASWPTVVVKTAPCWTDSNDVSSAEVKVTG
jgi:hypothetical protein